MKEPAPAPPRVLIVGQRFDGRIGGGITLSTLFSAFPPDSLAVAAYPPLSGELGGCDSYFLFGPPEDRLAWPFSLARSVPSPQGPLTRRSPGFATSATVERAPGVAVGRRAAAKARKKAHAAVVSVGLEPRIRSLALSARLAAWVKEFRPSLIYSQLSSLQLVRLVTELADATSVPVVLHFMDDWPATAYSGPLERRSRRALDGELPPLIERAATTLAIGQGMAAAYSARYRRRFGWFQNSIDLDLWTPHQKRDWSSSGTFRFAYTGRVGTANSSGVLTLCRVVSGMASAGRHVELVLVTSGDRRTTEPMRRLPGITVCTPVPHCEMPAFLSSFDALLLPLDFDARSVAFARYSMPTKLPEYLASGVPVVAHVPAATALAEYLTQRGCALVSTSPEPCALEDALIGLMDDEALRAEIAVRGVRVAAGEHDIRNVARRFRETLNEAAAAGGR